MKSRIGGLTLTLGLGALVSCRHAAPPAVIAPPELPAQELSPPVLTPAPAIQAAPDTAKEPHVDIDTHGSEVDVRTLLDYIGNVGHFKLVYSSDISKKIRVRLSDVPVSVALQTVLSLADLTLESAAPGTKAPGVNTVVFYQLPVNVDSLSVEAIMKRFGVGRTVAELIVQSRTVRP
jgi:hypothetical protein